MSSPPSSQYPRSMSLLLLVAAAIWGFAFVAQRAAMETMGPFFFTAIRFFLGALALVPLAKRSGSALVRKAELRAGSMLGLLLFGGASLQQVGLVYTTAGNAGFITGLYVVFVPFLMHLNGVALRTRHWLACGCAVIGLYGISDMGMLNVGDALELAGALVWAFHLLFLERVASYHRALPLAITQFMTCAGCSFLVALLFEDLSLVQLQESMLPLAYASFLSVSVAYTLQVVAQRQVPAFTAAIILCSEAVFAFLGGALLLAEPVHGAKLLACVFMIAAMILAQIPQTTKT